MFLSFNHPPQLPPPHHHHTTTKPTNLNPKSKVQPCGIQNPTKVQPIRFTLSEIHSKTPIEIHPFRPRTVKANSPLPWPTWSLLLDQNPRTMPISTAMTHDSLDKTHADLDPPDKTHADLYPLDKTHINLDDLNPFDQPPRRSRPTSPRPCRQTTR